MATHKAHSKKPMHKMDGSMMAGAKHMPGMPPKGMMGKAKKKGK